MKRYHLIIIGIAALMLLLTGCARQGDKSSGVVPVNGVELPYFIEGEGIPCIVTCDPVLQQHALSDELREHFKFIFLDPRPNLPCDKPDCYDNITMDTLVEDIKQVRQALGLDKVSILGHSLCGIFALEYARKYPEHVSRVIMVGTPPGYNPVIKNIENEYWESHASDERKLILEQNQAKLTEEALASMSPGEAKIAQYTASVPLTWYDPTYDISGLFEGYRENTAGWNHVYTTMMGKYDIESGDRITAPVFLAVGQYDFYVPDILWDSLRDITPDLTYHFFNKSGHFPHVEEQALFDSLLIDWIKGQ